LISSTRCPSQRAEADRSLCRATPLRRPTRLRLRRRPRDLRRQSPKACSFWSACKRSRRKLFGACLGTAARSHRPCCCGTSGIALAQWANWTWQTRALPWQCEYPVYGASLKSEQFSPPHARSQRALIGDSAAAMPTVLKGWIATAARMEQPASAYCASYGALQFADLAPPKRSRFGFAKARAHEHERGSDIRENNPARCSMRATLAADGLIISFPTILRYRQQPHRLVK
jgi:hypothetical protein